MVLLFAILQGYKFILSSFFDIPDAWNTNLKYEKESYLEVKIKDCFDDKISVIPAKVLIDNNICTVVKIGENVFEKCIGFTELKIPSSIVEIQAGAFRNCRNLCRVEIPAEVTEILGNPFANCKKLTEIHVSPDNPNYSSIDGVLYDKNGTEIICVPANKKGIFEIPEKVEKIRSNAFEGCEYLTDINMPSSVEEIGARAFSGCKSLEYINIPSSLKNIGSLAFYNCIGLKYLEIPSSVGKIEYAAFSQCENLDIVIDNYKENVDSDNSFVGCRSVVYSKDPTLKESKVYDLSETPLKFKISSNSSVKVIADNSYKGLSIIEIPAKIRIDNKVYEVTKIETNAFLGCDNLSRVYIPSSVISIGTSAFSGCRFLHVKINKKKKDVFVSDYAFQGCKIVEYIDAYEIAY